MGNKQTPNEDFTGDLKLNQLPKDSAEFKRLHEYVKRSLELAAAGNPKYEKLLKDDETRRVVESFVDYYGDIGVRYLQEGAADARHSPEMEEKHKEGKLAMKNAVDRFVQNYYETVKEAQKELGDSIRDLNEAGGTLTPRITAAKNTVDAILVDWEMVRIRQRVIVEFKDQLIQLLGEKKKIGSARVAVNEFNLKLKTQGIDDLRSFAYVTRIFNALPEPKAAEDLTQKDMDAVLKVLNEFAQLPPEKRLLGRKDLAPEEKRKQRLDFRNATPTVGDQLSFNDAIFDIDQQVVQEKENRKRLIFAAFPERAQFLYRLGGSDVAGLIKSSRRKDGKLDLDTMSLMLQTMLAKKNDPKFSVAELKSKIVFTDFDSAQVAIMAKKYALTEDGVKKLAQMILENGSSSVISEDIYSIVVRANGDYFRAISQVFGQDVMEDARRNAKGVNPDAVDYYLKQFRPNLTIDRSVAEDLSSVWKPKALTEYLENPATGYVNGPGISLPESYARASLPNDFVDYLKEQKLDYSVGEIYALSSIESLPADGKVTPKFVKELMNAFIDKDGFIDEVDFARMMKLLFNVSEVDSILKDKAIFTSINSKYKLKDRPALEAKITGMNGGEIVPKIKEYLQLVHKETFDNQPILQRLKLNALQLWKMSKEGGGVWYDYIKNLDGLVTDADGINSILDLSIQKTNALGEIRDTFADLERRLAVSEDGMRLADKALAEQEEERQLADELGSGLLRVPDRKPNAEAGELLLENFSKINERLVAAGLDRYPNDPKIRLTAYFLAREKSIEEAEVYLRNPNAYDLLKDDIGKKIEGQINQNKRIQVAEGQNVLLPLDFDLNVGLVPQASFILAQKCLLSGDLHYSQWLSKPMAARSGLETVLFNIKNDDIDGKTPLIEAFTTGVTQKITTRDGKVRDLTQADAIGYVQMIQKNLNFQTKDFDASGNVLENKNRQFDAMDILRKGGAEIGKLLKSPNWTEWGVGMTILVTAGYVLFQQWKKGNIGKTLLLSIPLLYGGDLIVKGMTGKGVLERIGATWMSKEARASAVESFLRDKADEPEYAEIDSDAGFEAMKILQNAPVEELLKWRDEVEKQPGKKNYGFVAPGPLRNEAYRIAKLQGSLGNPTEEDGYHFFYKVFDSLCKDVSVRNARAPTAASGANLIRERYVDFSEPFMLPFANDLRNKPPFTMLQVLIFERPTPAMQEALIQDDSFLEWAFRMVGIGVEELKSKLRGGMSFAQILAEHYKQKGEEYLPIAKEMIVDNGEKLLKWARRSGEKVYEGLKDESAATIDFALGTMKAIGVVAVDKGEGVLDWTFDAAQKGTDISIGAAKETYRFMRRHQVFDNATRFFEQGMERFFKGNSIAKLFILEETVKNDDEHVEKLAERLRWTNEFEKQLGTIVRMPADFEKTYLSNWITQATKEVLGTDLASLNEFDNLDGYKKMAVYEFIKRKVYSQLLARRIETIEAKPTEPLRLPLQYTLTKELSSSDELAKAIDRSYGYSTLKLMGAERTLAGTVEKWARNEPQGTARKALEFLHWGMDWATLDKATEYRIFQLREYLNPYEKEAEKVFEGQSEKLNMYKSYLETIVTNATLDLSLGALEAGFDSGEPPTETPLTLMISQAQGYLNYLKAARSTSADVDKIKDAGIKFEAFKIEPGSPEALARRLENVDLMRRIQASDPSEIILPMEVDANGVPVDPNKLPDLPVIIPLTPQETEEVMDLRLYSLKLEDLKKALDALPRADDTSAALLMKRFDNAATQIRDLKDPADREKAYIVLRGTSAAGAKPLREKLVKFFNQPEKLDELIRERNQANRPSEKERIQEVLDAAIVNMLEDIIADMEKVPSLAGDPRREQFERKLLALYKATSNPPDKTSDLVSCLLEYVKFMGDWSTPDQDGFTHFEKYTNYLNKQQKGLIPPPEEYYYFGGNNAFFHRYNGSKLRTQRDTSANNVSIAKDMLEGRKKELASQ